jgi:hypothetical protein
MPFPLLLEVPSLEENRGFFSGHPLFHLTLDQLCVGKRTDILSSILCANPKNTRFAPQLALGKTARLFSHPTPANRSSMYPPTP